MRFKIIYDERSEFNLLDLLSLLIAIDGIELIF